MPEMDIAKVAEHIANLRMQVNALEITAKNVSLPETLGKARSTVRWSAIIVSAALLASAAIHVWADKRVERLEKRIETLEKYHATSVAP